MKYLPLITITAFLIGCDDTDHRSWLEKQSEQRKVIWGGQEQSESDPMERGCWPIFRKLKDEIVGCQAKQGYVTRLSKNEATHILGSFKGCEEQRDLVLEWEEAHKEDCPGPVVSERIVQASSGYGSGNIVIDTSSSGDSCVYCDKGYVALGNGMGRCYGSFKSCRD